MLHTTAAERRQTIAHSVSRGSATRLSFLSLGGGRQKVARAPEGYLPLRGWGAWGIILTADAVGYSLSALRACTASGVKNVEISQVLSGAPAPYTDFPIAVFGIRTPPLHPQMWTYRIKSLRLFR